ncbi:hypothetical protein CFOL_v3_12333 [Cephalotus follicularis]|uniref:Uncharacterized protein n=1 Tax=Cephalotus follicularis TaxID=3775 RepID=A0A1Q3BLD0_CEPFO|nr:hypothetical protein CFOL_v3_12333 [Cephalotus follicularis]
MAPTVEVPVFIDTNLGTHIGMAVSPDITAGDFKRELERRHLGCFPSLGEIRVHGLMVKRRSCFYHLPESLPIKHAFQGLKGTWFLHSEARPLKDLDRPGLSKCMATELVNGSAITDSLFVSPEKNQMISSVIKHIPQELPKIVTQSKQKKKNHRANNFLVYEDDGIEIGGLDRNEDSPGVNAKEGVQEQEEQLKVKRNDKFSNALVDTWPRFTVRTPPRTLPFQLLADPRPETSTNKHERHEVGKRLVTSLKKLRISANKQRPIISLCRYKNGQVLGANASSMAKYLVFEISDKED